ncbi:unnamed protein product [Vitrella brassicaformis CCMP3155]|uniref:Glycosyl hydrolase family 13 catalytic domain-containing protein n=1 Tax=Vitrella brassicaformis (strain CCMP3155) TaxID=1169540 RepID=A0A0G4ECX5_VITBC|nr:unnamed protein product [Vitrella brassicaformis CCMP3155]|eukprot:CEL93177.1 unnamed protein product [Vitrella brassicaformis CCMP3155]
MGEETLRRDYPYKFFGAHVDGEKKTTTFRVYAPEATHVFLLRDANNWQKGEPLHWTRDGVWELEVGEDLTYHQYKYHIINDKGYLPNRYEMGRIDPFSVQLASEFRADGSRNFNSVVGDPDRFEWTHKHIVDTKTDSDEADGEQKTAGLGVLKSIYEVHLGSFWQGNYRDIAHKLVPHVKYLGFSHVQIMPFMQSPLYESWGYLVGCPYAVSERHGTIDDFKYLVNSLHENGIGVIADVPLGHGIQDWDCGLSSYDGTDLFHHSGGKGWNNEWKARVYNFSNEFVRNYLIGVLTYMYRELGIDGARLDAVSSQLFLDYDRGEWDWWPLKNDKSRMRQEDWDLLNGVGFYEIGMSGYELSEVIDLDTIHFYRDLHSRLAHTAPPFVTIAEESRRVLRRLAVPVEKGGAGFGYVQNLGEMHRMRNYIRTTVEYRLIQHVEMLIHDRSEEKYVNAYNTHDECSNGKLRLLTEFKNHVQLVGMAALCWFRAGVPMIFQGDEFGEEIMFDGSPGCMDWGKTGDHAHLHQKQMIQNVHDLNMISQNEPAMWRHDSKSMIRNGSNNELKFFSIIRFGSDKGWDSGDPRDHLNDIVFIRSEAPFSSKCHCEIHVPCGGLWQVIYNSIDEKYIGIHDYNRHDPYWSCHSGGGPLWIELKPFQNMALKLVSID